MVIKSPQRTITTEGSLSINGSPIEGVCSTQYLGVSIDCNLTWKPHIDKITKLVSRKVGIISQIRHYVPRSILILLYNSLILPQISYCLEIWGNTYYSLLKPIFHLQKKVVRLITFSDIHAHTAPLFQKLKILDVYKLCKLQTCLFVFDLKNNRFAHTIHHYLDPIPHNYPTRLAMTDSFYIPKMNLTVCQKTLKFTATNHWNTLPSTIKNEPNRHTFKSKLKNALLIQ